MQRSVVSFFAVVIAAVAIGCAAHEPARGSASRTRATFRTPVAFTATLDAASPLVGRSYDVSARQEIAWDALVEALSRARFALLGERHDHPDHHAVQARLVAELSARGARPAVAFEMLHARQAAALAEAETSAGGDAAAIARAVAWDVSGWPDFALYRPIFDVALAAGLPLVAANATPERVRAVARGQADPEARALLARAAPLPEAGRAELAAAIQRGHCGHAPEAMIGAMVEAQRVRDAAMAEALAAASEAHHEAEPGPAAVLIAGNGHVSKRTGVPLQLARLEPGARIASVALLEVQPGVSDPFAPGADLELELAGFDYVVFTPRLDDEDPCATFREQLERLERRPPAGRAPERNPG